MNRLQSEQHRLFLPRSEAHAETEAPSSALIDASDRVRAMVMELTGPPSWELLSKVWLGVQAELDLPAPAIAVSGIDGLQLWFSLAEPITLVQAHGFLEGLRSRFLPDIEPGRFRLMPAAEGSALRHEGHARLVPALQEQTGNWSAFVAPDLAPVFAETPWIDIPPNEEGQAALLRGLEVMKQTVFEAALKRLAPSPLQAQPAAMAPGADGPHMHMHTQTHAHSVTAAAGEEAERFLLKVMNDDAVALALRIDAAKALLRHPNDPRL